LKSTLGNKLTEPSGINRYPERWRRLDDLLATFQMAPTNFDSRTGIGLAELIHNAEPTTMLLNIDRNLFTLKRSLVEYPTSPADLAKTLAAAYREKGFDGGPLIDPYEEWVPLKQYTTPDLICSELNCFFVSMAATLNDHERKMALAASRKDRESLEGYEEDLKNHAFDEDRYLEEIFALKCCDYCFRLIPERSGETKTTIGKTCVLHDPRENSGIYKSGRNRIIAQKNSISEQRKNKKIDIERNANDPEMTPLRLNRLMSIVLIYLGSAETHDDGLFGNVKDIFSGNMHKLVDINLLVKLLDQVQNEFPEIARPREFASKIEALIKESKHKPTELIRIFGWFFHDSAIPFYPSIIAHYMRFFLEEAWFAQEHAPEYYGLDRDKGRPQKRSPASVVEAAEIFRENAMKKSEIIKTLASMFNYTDARVRQILNEQNFSW
jgi:hypothetical protein